MNSPCQSIYDQLVLIRHDKIALQAFERENQELFDLWRALYPEEYENELDNELEPIPALLDLRAIEATLFNNPRKINYAVGVKIWKYQSEKKFGDGGDWAGNVRLWNLSQWQREYKGMVKRSRVSFDVSEVSEALAACFEAKCSHAGLLSYKGTGVGTAYYPGYIVGAYITDNWLRGMFVCADILQLSLDHGFVNTDAKGNQLQPTKSGAQIVCQTRTAFDSSLANWASHIEEREEEENGEVE